MTSLARVTVVGGGVIGRTVAVVLAERGHPVTVVTADPTSATTSHLAAGSWFPTLVGPRERVFDWGARTFTVLHDLARTAGAPVVVRRTLGLDRDPDPPPPWWGSAVGGVTRTPAHDLPPGYASAWEFPGPIAVMPRYLPWLVARAEALGVRTLRLRVAALEQVAALGEVTVDATGLAARELAGDPSVHAVQGQLVRVSDPGLRCSLRDELHPDGPTYIHPRGDDVVLGGTARPGVEGRTPDAEVGSAIVARCTALVPALAGAKVLEHAVGLRPARPTVRHELVDDGPVPVVHHYGHGGAGLTCSWGGAEAVAALVRDATR